MTRGLGEQHLVPLPSDGFKSNKRLEYENIVEYRLAAE